MNKPEILIVEDNDLLQLVIPPMVKNMGCNVTVAQNGHEALEMCTFKFDLILLDVGLPDISGLEVCKKIRALKPRAEQIPILAFTAYGDTMKDECKEAGFNALIVKGASPQALKEILQRWLPTYQLLNPFEDK